jgi:hypothetical protein
MLKYLKTKLRAQYSFPMNRNDAGVKLRMILPPIQVMNTSILVQLLGRDLHTKYFIVMPNILIEDGNVRRKATDETLVNMITEDSLKIVEDLGFRRFVHTLDSRYSLPSRKRLRQMVAEKYQAEFVAVKAKLAEAEYESDCRYVHIHVNRGVHGSHMSFC